MSFEMVLFYKTDECLAGDKNHNSEPYARTFTYTLLKMKYPFLFADFKVIKMFSSRRILHLTTVLTAVFIGEFPTCLGKFTH